MALQIDTVAHTCQLISREIREYHKGLTIHYIVHREGQRTEALGLAAQEILHHPASETAMHVLQKQKRSEESVMLGTAVASQNLFFGLATRDSILALCTINIDQFNTLKETQRHAYHLAWHAIDALEYHRDPQNRRGGSKEVIVRRRNALEMASANLRADVFSVAISALHRDKEAVRRTALTRGINALHTKSLYSPEFYPYVIALEAAEFALGQINASQIPKKKLIPVALKVAREVGMTFDEITLKNWLAFAEPAQDMAWRGYSEAEILSAAINTSPNTYVRAIGYLISELTSIVPAPIAEIRETYSPFADNVFNEKLHNKMVDQIYQDIIAQGLKQDSATPFVQMANQQNNALTEGRIMGWCASALQAAGSAFDSAKRNGQKPEQFATREFDAGRNNTNWNDLDELGKRVIKSHRDGDPVTMSDIKELSGDIATLVALRQSVEKTLADPHYRHQIAAVNELHAVPKMAPEMTTPAPVLTATPAAPVHAISIPGLGGSKKVAAAQTAVQQKKKTQDEGKQEK